MRNRVKLDDSKEQGTTFQKTKEIKTVRTDEEANKLLSEGWELLYAGQTHIDNNGFNSKTSFIMARIK